MKAPGKVSLQQRDALKKASRRADRERLAKGESPDVIQRENSIFPGNYFGNHRFLNLSSAVGK